MKPVFKCEWCEYMGDEDDVLFHEEKCTEHPRTCKCWSCKHAKRIRGKNYEVVIECPARGSHKPLDSWDPMCCDWEMEPL